MRGIQEKLCSHEMYTTRADRPDGDRRDFVTHWSDFLDAKTFKETSKQDDNTIGRLINGKGRLRMV